MNFTDYKLKLEQKLKHFKIPQNEYSFEGEKAENCLFVEQDGDFWRVCISRDNKKTVRGLFYKENIAYDFLFYLVMKNHVDFKKRWW